MKQANHADKEKKILILSDYYLPGYKSGGGMRTIVNMVDRLGNEFKFFIITRDHDGKLDREQYKTVKINRWNTVGNAQVYYLSKKNLNIWKLRDLILKVKPEVIYSNSYFANLTFYLLILKRLRLLPDVKVVLAPCGELAQGALELNSGKKNAYIKFVKIFDLYRNLIWKASSELEKTEIEIIKGSGGQIFIAPDMLPRAIFAEYEPKMKPQKLKGQAKLIFLSRFMKKKNFRWLLENLSGIEGKLEIDIYGPLEDADYWLECEKIIQTLPGNIIITSKGSVPHEQVLQTLAKYHFFIMPTLGENFGHIFLESLAAGCPLIISDKTPWLDLKKKGIGWDLPLNNPSEWIDKLNYCIDLNQADYSHLSDNARKFALGVIIDEKFEIDTLNILQIALEN